MMLNKAVAYGYRNAGFILDRGYFSRENIRYMDKCGYDFVIMVKGMKSLCNDAIRQVDMLLYALCKYLFNYLPN